VSKRIEVKGLKTLPPVSMSLDDMGWNHNGDWGFFSPVHREKTSPCAADCPVGEPIHQYMHLVKEGKYRTAWEMIMAVNPLPAVCGRVCYHPCESRCNRREMDEPINIHCTERFLGDLAIEERWKLSPPKKELDGPPMVIVGSGPAGLSCAYHLRLLGYPVEIYERESAPGGMLRVGVPGFRLPRHLLDAEIERLAEIGVRFRCGENVSDLEAAASSARAVFLATGAHGSRDPRVNGFERRGVFFGLDFLKAFNAGNSPKAGKFVAVVGGGNTAIDVARVSRRLGAEVELLYRRTREEMPAHPEEVEQALAEGVKLRFQVAPTAVMGESEQGPADGLNMLRMRQGEPDESGRARPEPVAGSDFRVKADSVVFAIGETPELGYLNGRGESDSGRLGVDRFGRTGIPGVFAGGDISPGENTVTHGLADGRAAARYMDLILSGIDPADHEPEQQEVVDYSKINQDYFEQGLPRREMPVKIQASPDNNGRELDETFSPGDAGAEAERCFNCGTCVNCDNCLIFCPDLAVSCVNGDYKVKKEYCKGCGICAQECPRYIITMERKS
jgi:NADPH-dependent glutamate synthase beta subunit-like oxidoreductase/Pyruvate/2-oxoacid:ferredoxin oxidoreductase delta subunit